MPGDGRGCLGGQASVGVHDAEDHPAGIDVAVRGVGQDRPFHVLEGRIERRRFPDPGMRGDAGETSRSAPDRRQDVAGVVVGTVIDHQDDLAWPTRCAQTLHAVGDRDPPLRAGTMNTHR